MMFTQGAKRALIANNRRVALTVSRRLRLSTATSAPTAASGGARAGNKRLTIDTMSKAIVNMQYAVRGQVVIAADKINEELQESGDAVTDYPFDKIIYTK